MSIRWDRATRISALLLAVLFVVFGVITFARSCLQHTRKTDLTVYLRAAWAIRAGEDLYSVTDEHDWHYHYPPLLAALLTPLAQPPAGSNEQAAVPFGTVVVMWYCLSVVMAAAAGPWLAGHIGTEAVHREGRYRRWLVHVPLWALAPALFSSLGRGQVNEIVLILLTGMVVCAVRHFSIGAGAFLAAAACVKVIPAFLIVYPLWKRDWRWVGATAAGLIVGLFLLPMAFVGPSRTFAMNRSWVTHVIDPVFSHASSDRDEELLGMTATDNQSFQGAIHNMRYPDRASRPDVADPSTRMAHYFLGGLLTFVTLVAGRRSDMKDPQREALTITALFVPMLLTSPVCHLHYFVILIPLIVSLVAGHLINGRCVRPALAGTLILVFITQLLPRIPGLEFARDIGLASFGALALWAAAVIELSGEAVLKVRLPGYRKAMALWRPTKIVTIHEPLERPKTVDMPRRRAS